MIDIAVETTHLLQQMQPLMDSWGYPGLFFLIMIEGFGIPTPGQSLLIVASILAGQGHLSIVTVLTVAWSAAFIGNTIGYCLGLYAGLRIFKLLRLSDERLVKFERFYARWGVAAIILGRFLEGLKQLGCLLAGALHLKAGAFVMANFAAVTLWTLTWGWLPWVIEKDYQQRLFAVHEHRLLLSTIAVGCLLAIVVWWWRRSNSN